MRFQRDGEGVVVVDLGDPLLGTSGTSTWTLVAMPWRVRTARMPRSREANEFVSSSCSGKDPYKLEPRGILDGDSVASGW